jgi:hypothetical protein
MVGRHGRMLRIRTVTAAAAGALALAAAPTALAQSPTIQGYSQPGGTIQQQISPSPAPAQPAPTATVTPTQAPTKPVAAVSSKPASKGKLPFTGLDIALVLAAGAVLMGLGFGLRRFTRPTEAA